MRVPCAHGVLMMYSRGTRGVLAYHLTGYSRTTSRGTRRVLAAISKRTRGIVAVLAAYSRRTPGVLAAYGVGCRLQLRPLWPQAARRPPQRRRAVLPRAPHASRTPTRVTVSVSLSMDVHGKMFTDMHTAHPSPVTPSPASPTGAPTPSPLPALEYHLSTRLVLAKYPLSTR
jgi:hypothetical protein